MTTLETVAYNRGNLATIRAASEGTVRDYRLCKGLLAHLKEPLAVEQAIAVRARAERVFQSIVGNYLEAAGLIRDTHPLILERGGIHVSYQRISVLPTQRGRVDGYTPAVRISQENDRNLRVVTTLWETERRCIGYVTDALLMEVGYSEEGPMIRITRNDTGRGLQVAPLLSLSDFLGTAREIGEKLCPYKNTLAYLRGRMVIAHTTLQQARPPKRKKARTEYEVRKLQYLEALLESLDKPLPLP